MFNPRSYPLRQDEDREFLEYSTRFRVGDSTHGHDYHNRGRVMNGNYGQAGPVPNNFPPPVHDNRIYNVGNTPPVFHQHPQNQGLNNHALYSNQPHNQGLSVGESYVRNGNVGRCSTNTVHGVQNIGQQSLYRLNANDPGFPERSFPQNAPNDNYNPSYCGQYPVPVYEPVPVHYNFNESESIICKREVATPPAETSQTDEEDMFFSFSNDPPTPKVNPPEQIPVPSPPKPPTIVKDTLHNRIQRQLALICVEKQRSFPLQTQSHHIIESNNNSNEYCGLQSVPLRKVKAKATIHYFPESKPINEKLPKQRYQDQSSTLRMLLQNPSSKPVHVPSPAIPAGFWLPPNMQPYQVQGALPGNIKIKTEKVDDGYNCCTSQQPMEQQQFQINSVPQCGGQIPVMSSPLQSHNVPYGWQPSIQSQNAQLPNNNTHIQNNQIYGSQPSTFTQEEQNRFEQQQRPHKPRIMIINYNNRPYQLRLSGFISDEQAIQRCQAVGPIATQKEIYAFAAMVASRRRFFLKRLMAERNRREQIEMQMRNNYQQGESMEQASIKPTYVVLPTMQQIPYNPTTSPVTPINFRPN